MAVLAGDLAVGTAPSSSPSRYERSSATQTVDSADRDGHTRADPRRQRRAASGGRATTATGVKAARAGTPTPSTRRSTTSSPGARRKLGDERRCDPAVPSTSELVDGDPRRRAPTSSPAIRDCFDGAAADAARPPTTPTPARSRPSRCEVAEPHNERLRQRHAPTCSQAWLGAAGRPAGRRCRPDRRPRRGPLAVAAGRRARGGVRPQPGGPHDRGAGGGRRRDRRSARAFEGDVLGRELAWPGDPSGRDRAR